MFKIKTEKKKKKKGTFITKKIKGSIVFKPTPLFSVGLEASSAKTEEVPSEE